MPIPIKILLASLLVAAIGQHSYANSPKPAMDIPDSIYLDLVDSLFADMQAMQYVHPVLEHLGEGNRKAYPKADGHQIRIFAQHNARGLPHTDHYTIMEMMIDLPDADHQADHAHEAGTEPLLKYWEREMGVGVTWHLGRMKMHLDISGKGNESLAQLITEGLEKRLKTFREANGLPKLFRALSQLPEKETTAARRLHNDLLALEMAGRKAGRTDLQLSSYTDHEERRLGLTWSGASSHRITLSINLMDEQPPAEDQGDLGAGSFRFRTIRREHIAIQINVASEEDSPLGQEVNSILERHMPQFE